MKFIDFEKLAAMFLKYWDRFLLTGVGYTLSLAAITVGIGTIFAALLALMKMSKIPPFRWLSSIYIEIIRGTPMLLQLYFFYFGLPMLIPALQKQKYVCVAIALICNSAAYVSEVIRDGIFKLIFFIGCSVGLIPSVIFATNYFKVMTRYNHRQTNSFIRFCVTIINVVELLLFYYSAVSVIGVAYCDMDTYPDQHTLFSFSWVILTNVMELIQLVQMKCTLYKNSTRSLHSL